jgi:hypothetical protein
MPGEIERIIARCVFLAQHHGQLPAIICQLVPTLLDKKILVAARWKKKVPGELFFFQT